MRPAPNATLLAAELRANRPAALRRVRSAIEKSGTVKGAAEALGVSVRTLQNWALPGSHAPGPDDGFFLVRGARLVSVTREHWIDSLTQLPEVEAEPYK